MAKIEWKKVEDETEKKIILALSERNYDSYSSLSEKVNISRQWLKEKIKKMEVENIVTNKPINNKPSFGLNKKRVKIKKFSLELFKQLIMLPTFGLLFNFILAFYFGVNSLIFIFGGLSVFTPQFLYSFYKILSTEEGYEVFVR